MKAFKASTAVFAAVAFSCIASSASGAVIGHLDTANCGGGGVTVTATTIDWTPPTDAGSGCITTGTNTNITYSGGTLTPNQVGTILDLTTSMSFPIAGFMTFTSAPGLTFDLTGLGPGVNNTVCSATLDPNNASCSPFAGSPFILTPTATGTSVTLSAMGTANDGTTPATMWSGAFTTQISGRTPFSIATNINNGGSESSTHSGDFTLSMVPEPTTTVLLGSALVALGLTRRRLQKR